MVGGFEWMFVSGMRVTIPKPFHGHNITKNDFGRKN
jgi:hypothetical protein